MRLFLLGYALLWVIALPLVLLYLLWRSRRDPLYSRYIAERFGIYLAVTGELRFDQPIPPRLLAPAYQAL